MSEIDCHRHIHLGDLAEMPLYVLTNKVPAGAIEDHFTLTEQDLVLGEGSGGPAAAQLNALKVLQHYICHMMYLNLDDTTMDTEDWVKGDAFPGVSFSDLDAAADILAAVVGEGLAIGDYAAWGGDQWFYFMTRASNDKNVNNPYDIDKHSGIEYWIDYSIGEFLLLNHLDFVLSFVKDEEKLQEKLKSLQAYVSKNSFFDNVKEVSY